MAISDEVKQETKKMKQMTPKQKISYIWEYYKIPIIGSIAGIILLSVFIHDWIENNKPTYLYAVFINSNFVYDDTSTILDDYISEEAIDQDQYNLYIDMSMSITDDSDQLTLGNQQKIMALLSSGELDSMTGPADIIDRYASLEAYADLDTLLPDDLKQELADKGYEFYYSTYEDGEHMTGVYMDSCDYLNSQGTDGAFSDAAEEGLRPVFTITVNASEPEHAIAFLRMMIR